MAAVVAVACVDLSAPSGPASISLIQVPEFFVVINDVMRDTLGNPAKPALIGFDATNNVLTDVNPFFFTTDSIQYAHFNGQGQLTGVSLGTAHIVGQVDALQTPSTNIFVTVIPVRLANTTAPTDSLVLAGGAVDSASSVSSIALNAQLQGALVPPQNAAPGVGGGIIRYKIVYMPPAKGTVPVAVLTDNGLLTPVDTGDPTGNVSRTLLVDNRQFAQPGIVAGTQTDSIVVVASIMYKGDSLQARFRIRLRSPLAK